MSEKLPTDTREYLKGGKHEKLDYDKMIGELSSEQVREIAIARANARKNKDEDLVTIKEDTQGKLEVIKLDTNKPQRITISDSVVDTELQRILRYNFSQIKKFENEMKTKFSQKETTIPETGKRAFEAFKKVYNSDIYSSESFENIKKLQELLKFTGTDVDGKFGPKTQNELKRILSIPLVTPAPAATPAPAPAATALAPNGKKTILDPNTKPETL